MSAGHTPGPWSLDGLTVYVINEEATNNRFLVQVQGGHIVKHFERGIRTPKGELAANARLIAAAPDLLEALAALAESVTLRSLRGRDHVPSMRLQQDAMRSAHTAIAKATGASSYLGVM